MTNETTNSFSAISQIDFRELPLHQLLAQDISQMTDDQLRELDKIVQEDRIVPAARRAKVIRESKKLEGKPVRGVSANVDDLL